MKLSLGFGVILSLAVAAVGTHFFTIYKFSGKASYRRPASVNPRALDLSDAEVMDSISKQRILSGAQAWKEKGLVALRIGHFLARDAQGKTNELCEMYQEIALSFAAEGIAVSGDKPTMTIYSPCYASKDANSTETIWLPVEKILAEKAADTELRFTSPSNITVKLQNIPGEWPGYWVLTEIKLINKNDGRFLSIDKPTIYKMSQVPMSVSFF